MRCCASVSQNQSAESSVSARKRCSLPLREWTSLSRFLAEKRIQPYTAPAESSARRTASSMGQAALRADGGIFGISPAKPCCTSDRTIYRFALS